MTITLDDIEDAWMNADAKFNEWSYDYAAKHFQPIIEDELVTRWRTMGEQEHAALRALYPDMYDAVKKLVGTLEVSYGKGNMEQR